MAQRGQRIDVGRFQLRQLPVLQHQLRHFVLARQPFEHIDRRRYGLALAVLDRLRQVQLVEQHVAQLLRRVDVELHARQLVDLPRQRLRVALQPLRHLRQHVAVELHAGFFHGVQHRDQRQIDLVVHLLQAGLFHLAVRSFAASRSVMSAASGKRSRQLQIQAPQRNIGQAIGGVRRIEQVLVQHGVVLDRLRAASPACIALFASCTAFGTVASASACAHQFSRFAFQFTERAWPSLAHRERHRSPPAAVAAGSAIASANCGCSSSASASSAASCAAALTPSNATASG